VNATQFLPSRAAQPILLGGSAREGRNNRDTSKLDLSAGVARSVIDGVNQIVRPRLAIQNVINNRVTRRGQLGEFFLREDDDSGFTADADVLRPLFAGFSSQPR